VNLFNLLETLKLAPNMHSETHGLSEASSTNANELKILYNLI